MSQQRLEILAVAVVLATCANARTARAADGLDRYGGRARTTVQSYGQQPGDRLLSWPGKVEPAATAAPAPSSFAAWPTSASAPGPVASSAFPTGGASGATGPGVTSRPMIMAGLAPPSLTSRPFVPENQVPPRVEARPDAGWVAMAPASPPPPAAPVAAMAPPVYAPATSPAVTRLVAARVVPPVVAKPTAAEDRSGDAHVRLYSLHRDYGMEPDAVPLPPSSFTASADLAGQDQVAAAPQPSPKTPQGRTAITAARIADGSDGQP